MVIHDDPCHHVHNHALCLCVSGQVARAEGQRAEVTHDLEDEAQAVRGRIKDMRQQHSSRRPEACNGAATAALLSKTDGGRYSVGRPAGRVVGIYSTQAAGRRGRGSQGGEAREEGPVRFAEKTS